MVTGIITLFVPGCQDDNNSSHNEEREMAEMRHFHTCIFYTLESEWVRKLIGSDPLAFMWRNSRVNWETATKTKKSILLMWQHMLLLLLLLLFQKNIVLLVLSEKPSNEEWKHIKIHYCHRRVKRYVDTDITKKGLRSQYIGCCVLYHKI